MLESAFLVAAADGTLGDDEVDALAGALVELSDGEIDAEEIEPLLEEFSAALERDGFENRVAAVASALPDHDARRAAFLVALAVASADDELNPEEDAVFEMMSRALRVSPDEMAELLAQLNAG
jgi:tellurite resistance protein